MAYRQLLKQEGDVFFLAAKLYNDNNELLPSATAKAKRMELTKVY
jgi:hypothetical protein